MERAARAANAHEFICALPEGYNTVVANATLSGGQIQRLAIARAVMLGTRLKVLVLDEATSALDAENERQVRGPSAFPAYFASTAVAPVS